MHLFYASISIISAIVSYNSANKFFKITSDAKYSYYWLDYRYSAIQTPNNMLLIGAIVLIIIGYILGKSSIISFDYIPFISISLVTVSIFATGIFYFLIINYRSSIYEWVYIESIKSVVGYYLFVFFWLGISYILSLKFRSLIIALVLIMLQIVETIYIPFMTSKSFILKYLPVTITRDIVIGNFPFWLETSLSSRLGVNSYANITPPINGFSEMKPIDSIWVYCGYALYFFFAWLILVSIKKKG